jgi:ribosomal protein S18 acetylase RimI-like enzyme
MGAPVVIRARADDDLDACAALARETHVVDGYPVFVRDDDFRGFVAPRSALAAFVGERAGEIVGHVALHPSTVPAVMALAQSSLGVEPDGLGVVARLIVAPAARRLGIARRLLETATAAAHERGLVPILDVVTRHDAAIALYEAVGWQCLGTVAFALPDGSMIDERVYRAPEAG